MARHPHGHRWMDNEGNLRDEFVPCVGCKSADVSQIDASDYCQECSDKREDS